MPTLVHRPISLEPAEQQLARNAWQYFESNRLPTGLVSSADRFPATTMWDVASQLGGMTAARELELLAPAQFDRWMTQVLKSLAKLPLYKGELPNKAYNAATLQPVNYGQLYQSSEIGFSALDLGRLSLWLDLIAARYPHHAADCRAVTARWHTQRLVRNGDLMGTDNRHDREQWNQEGRLGYEQYAAYGLKKIGVVADRALDAHLHHQDIAVMGVPIPADIRTSYHYYVTSEPYILDGIETGFKSLPVEFAQRVLSAQQRRYRSTGKFTAWSEDNLDRLPWFVYSCVLFDGTPWQTISIAHQNNPGFIGDGKKKISYDSPDLRVSSTKTAIGWHVLFRSPYTEAISNGLGWIADPERGVFGGVYEETQLPNRALTLNTNGLILESLLYGRLGSSLEDWAHRNASKR